MTFVLGSRNLHKLEEMTQLLPKVPLASLPEGIAEPVEDGKSFAENAAIKSLAYAKATGQWVIADDSGICIEALGGAPGIYSARFAHEKATDEENNQHLLQQLAGQKNREAHYVCVLSLASPEREIFSVEGKCFGRILEVEEGSNGFGYDSLFYSHDLKQSFGVSDPKEKSRVSHRAAACQAFFEELSTRELLK